MSCLLKFMMIGVFMLLMEVRSRSSEVKSERNTEIKCLQNMKDMFRVCETLYAELRSFRIGDNDCQAPSIQLSGADHAGYVAEVLRKSGAAKMPKEMLKVPCY